MKSDNYKYKLLKTNMLRKYEDLNDILKIASKYQDEVISISYIKEDDLFGICYSIASCFEGSVSRS